MANEIRLSDLITNVADELRKVNAKSDPQKAVMQFEECEFNLQVQITSTDHLGIKLYILDAGTSSTDVITHSVKLKFSKFGRAITAVAIKEGDGRNPNN